MSGGASGIGEAAVRKFVGEGAKVVIADVNTSLGERLSAELGAQAEFVRLDVADPQAWSGAVDAVVAHAGGLNVLVNSAGIQIGGVIDEVTDEDWQRVMGVNLNGTFFGCRAAFPEIRRAGGAIVNISSSGVLQGYQQYPAYSAAKAGVIALTQSIAAYCRNGGYPVRCNAILPGGIETPMVHDAIRREFGLDPTSEMAAPMLAALGRPSQVADTVAYLASDEASFVNGQSLLVDGASTFTVPAASLTQSVSAE
ncbi:SDR family oxidoreductase [Mycolicibacterium porcinum]|uniref:SDR family oxidoreductase n=1 Tax=Mycolicibacterium porcinum TaxID=39693 RepID=A0AAW5SUC6_9MYCO|nr:SDR family oxidoreductase [Mycolicibacterium porcinum]MCV7386491.1 SDR family oxidoreductase [Mycolicibacterium porcinum]